MRGHEARGQRARRRERDLLTEHRLDRELGAIDRPRGAQTWALLDNRRKPPIFGEHLDDAQGVGIEVEQAATLAHRARQVRHRLEFQRASNVAVDWLEAHNRSATRQAERAPIGLAVGLRDPGHGSGAEPAGQRGPIERWPVGKTERQRAFDDVAAPPACRAQSSRSQREHFSNRVVELPHTLEARGERYVGERQVGGFDQRASGLGALRPGDREWAGTELRQQQPMKVTLTGREPAGEPCNAVAVDDALGDHAHRPADEVTANIPFG